MRVKVAIGLIVVLLALGGVGFAVEANQKYHGLGFSVDIDSTIKIISKSPIGDFEIYDFYDDERLLFNAYSGNHPSFPFSEKTTAPVKVNINGFDAECYESVDVKKNHSKECLIELKNDFPAVVHLWYIELSQADKIKADTIINSIERSDVKK